MRKLFGLVPLQGLVSSASDGLSHGELQGARRVQDTGALSRTTRGDFLTVKSEELRSSTIQLNELCLTSLLGALLPHPPPPPPVSPLFVCAAWECQLPLVEDAAYGSHLSLFLSLTHSLSLWFRKTPSRLMQNLLRGSKTSLWKSLKESTQLSHTLTCRCASCRFSEPLCPYWTVFDVSMTFILSSSKRPINATALFPYLEIADLIRGCYQSEYIWLKILALKIINVSQNYRGSSAVWIFSPHVSVWQSLWLHIWLRVKKMC